MNDAMPVKPTSPITQSKHLLLLNQIRAQIIKIPHPRQLNIRLKLLMQSAIPQHAFLLYNKMLHHQHHHNHYTFIHALKACSLTHAFQKGLEIHAHLIKSGHFFDLFVQNSLLHFYVVENDISSAYQTFNSICLPDVVSWTSIISGLSKSGFQGEAIRKFSSMNVKPNAASLVSVISSCSSLRALRLGKAIHGYCLRNIVDHNVILDNAVLDFYVKCGTLLTAKFLFVKMPSRDVVSWTAMIGGLAQTSAFCQDAFWVFQEMLQGGEAQPNEATLANVLSACSSISALSLGQWVHSYLITSRPDLLASNVVANALINMYVKCGNVALAIQAFNILDYKDIISWSSIISGLAMNGFGRQAIQLFSLMLVHGLHPDHVTFVGLLCACSHAGLVNQGLIFFKAMCNVYRIVPQVQHYACIVDVYARAGLLEEAVALIKEMPVEAEGPIWGAMLNACKIHENQKMFEIIRQGLVKSKQVSVGTFALLSNAYASSNRWDDANIVRDEMRHIGLKKLAGCSWIEVDQSNSKLFDPLDSCSVDS